MVDQKVNIGVAPPPQPFYSPLSGTTRVSRCQNLTSALYGARGDLQRQTYWPSGWPPLNPDYQCPPPPLPHIFSQAGCPSCRPTNSVKALKVVLVKFPKSLYKTRGNFWNSGPYQICCLCLSRQYYQHFTFSTCLQNMPRRGHMLTAVSLYCPFPSFSSGPSRRLCRSGQRRCTCVLRGRRSSPCWHCLSCLPQQLAVFTPQPFYGLFPGPPAWASARRELLDFMVQGEINRGRNTDRTVLRPFFQDQPGEPEENFWTL